MKEDLGTHRHGSICYCVVWRINQVCQKHAQLVTLVLALALPSTCRDEPWSLRRWQQSLEAPGPGTTQGDDGLTPQGQQALRHVLTYSSRECGNTGRNPRIHSYETWLFSNPSVQHTRLSLCETTQILVNDGLSSPSQFSNKNDTTEECTVFR